MNVTLTNPLSPDTFVPINESNSVDHQQNLDQYPTVDGWIKKQLRNSTKDLSKHCLSHLPFISWIYRYNLTWLVNDLIAGLTVGAIVIPQGMAYAGLAKLPVQFGLYSSLMGVIVYWIFATSKDITIGPVAVVSALVASIIDAVQSSNPMYESHVIASALSLIAGCLICIFGILRLGFIVDFIPQPALSAFMTGSALTIAMGQIPVMMGNNKFVNTRDPAYLVLVNFFREIDHCNWNAAMGLSSLILLYIIRFTCEYGRQRFPRREKFFFFFNTLRVVFVINIFLFLSWLINRDVPNSPRTSILGVIPRGFQQVGVPYIDQRLFQSLLPYLPATVVVLLIEHIAIAKSFGRLNNYSIDTNQELIAISVTNIFGPFFGAYPATGSFSRTAIKSKAGVRTPLAGIFSGLLIILGIYALTDVFFWISQASLGGVIIHAVGDLISGPATWKIFWKSSPLEFFIFWIGVIVTCFSNIENGIYSTVILSVLILLYRVARARGMFLVRTQLRKENSSIDESNDRFIFVPIDENDDRAIRAVNHLSVNQALFIYRLNENFLYPNANSYMEHLANRIFAETKPGRMNHYKSLGDQPWNLKTSRHPQLESQQNDERPTLHGIILDFTGVAHIDVTALQILSDVREQFNRYADKKVLWHFVGLSNPWIKRGLISFGFGSADGTPSVVTRNNPNEGSQLLGPMILSTNSSLFHHDLDQAYQTILLQSNEVVH